MDITFASADRVEILSEKKILSLAPSGVTLDGMAIELPGEYEKSGILATCAKFAGTLFVRIVVEGRAVAYVPVEKLDVTQDVLDFLGDIDVLVILGTKESAKLAEGLESRVVIPFGEMREQFLHALGQSLEPVKKYRPKDADFDGASVVYVAFESSEG